MATPKRAADYYRAGNLECARIIAAEPERYGGLLAEWAELVIEKSKPRDRECGPLFKAA
jgi:hypothetical protein